MMPIRYGSVCSGIEAASAAWLPLGWQCQFMSEIEAFPRAVLAHHYPDTPLHGDFTTIQDGEYGPIDVLVGGTPCQSFSVAGLRGGMGDARGNLALEYLRLAERLRPAWLVWENVPGVLSSWSCPEPPGDLSEGEEWETRETSDFGCFLAGMAELGYGFAYRVLDACYFGVPQQRSRVFVVAHADWRRAAAVLFEPDSFSRSVAPRLPAALSVCITRRGPGSLDDREPYIVEGQNPRHMTPLEIERAFGFPDNYTAIPASVLREVRRCQTAGRLPPPAARPDGQALMVQSMRERGAEGVTQEERPSACQKSLEPCNTIRADGGLRKRDEGSAGRALRHLSCSSTSLGGGPRPQDGCGARDALPSLQHQDPSHREHRVSQSSVGVSKPVVADGPRYLALGNSMPVPVMSWIGRRIARQQIAIMQVTK